MKRSYTIASETALIIYFGDRIEPLVSKEVQRAYKALKQANIEGFFELIPSYASLLIQYDILKYRFEQVRDMAEECIEKAPLLEHSEQKIVTIPSYYGREVGLDLELLCEEKNLSSDAIVSLHVKELYSVYAIGFAPGFAYMGEIDEALSTSRLASPRKVVPKGSVAIADRQTAIYPLQSPGGWKILGRTPMVMFDASYEGLSRLHVGDLVRFEPISKEAFLKMGGLL